MATTQKILAGALGLGLGVAGLSVVAEAGPMRAAPPGVTAPDSSVTDVAYRARRRHATRHRHYRRAYRYNPAPAIFGTMLGAIAAGAVGGSYYGGPYYGYGYPYGGWGYGYGYPAYGYPYW